jgi:hypothetical protein
MGKGADIQPVRDTRAMIAGMRPALQPGLFVFCTTADQPSQWVPHALASFREAEGLSLVLPLEMAAKAGFDVSMPMCQITLTVHSALDGIGLTAAVAGALTEIGVPCNMIAGYHHDHVFVPHPDADKALECLTALAGSA